MFEEYTEIIQWSRYDDSDPERTWITHDLLCCGDYGGAGAIGTANIQFLKNHAEKYITMDAWKATFHNKFFYIMGDEVDLSGVDLIIVESGFNGETAYVLVGSELESEISGLDQYPAIDDEWVVEIEDLWRKEYMDYLYDEVRQHLWSRYENFSYWWDLPCHALIQEDPSKEHPTPYECFNDLFEQVVREESQNDENMNCWEYEYSAATFVDYDDKAKDRIVNAFIDRLRGVFAEEGRPAHNRKLARERQLKLI